MADCVDTQKSGSHQSWLTHTGERKFTASWKIFELFYFKSSPFLHIFCSWLKNEKENHKYRENKNKKTNTKAQLCVTFQHNLVNNKQNCFWQINKIDYLIYNQKIPNSNTYILFWHSQATVRYGSLRSHRVLLPEGHLNV